jgi:hypothetical protein
MSSEEARLSAIVRHLRARATRVCRGQQLYSSYAIETYGTIACVRINKGRPYVYEALCLVFLNRSGDMLDSVSFC